MNARAIVAVGFGVLVIGWAIWVVSNRFSPVSPTAPPATTVVDGKQIIEIVARGGYSPRSVIAKTGVPTIIRVRTNNTFDCSASLVIPKISYQKFLKPTGIEDIEIPTEQARGTLRGLCAMGMYSFQIIFE